MAVKRIFSAGGIVLRRFAPQDKQSLRSSSSQDSTAGLKFPTKPHWKVLVTQHSKYKGWDFPKGHIELGEASESAALREVKEETGIRAEIIEKVGSTQYFYFDQGEQVLKQVTFYLMKYVSKGEVTTAFEVSAKKWLAPDEVEGQLTFKDTKELWGKAKEKIEHGKWLASPRSPRFRV